MDNISVLIASDGLYAFEGLTQVIKHYFGKHNATATTHLARNPEEALNQMRAVPDISLVICGTFHEKTKPDPNKEYEIEYIVKGPKLADEIKLLSPQVNIIAQSCCDIGIEDWRKKDYPHMMESDAERLFSILDGFYLSKN